MDAGHVSNILAAYDDWAEIYDTTVNRTRDLAAVVLRQTRLGLAGREVLEIGCGTGLNTEWLAAQSRRVLALDFSSEMLRHAQARVRSSRMHFVRHDVRLAWPLAESSTDIVIAMLVLEHVEHLQFIFTEAARVLRSGGEMFLCELHPMRQLQGCQAEFTDPRTSQQVRVPAFLHDTSEYVNVGLRAGFQLIQIGEWRDSEAPRHTAPRLLSLRFRLDVRPSA